MISEFYQPKETRVRGGCDTALNVTWGVFLSLFHLFDVDVRGKIIVWALSHSVLKLWRSSLNWHLSFSIFTHPLFFAHGKSYYLLFFSQSYYTSYALLVFWIISSKAFPCRKSAFNDCGSLCDIWGYVSNVHSIREGSPSVYMLVVNNLTWSMFNVGLKFGILWNWLFACFCFFFHQNMVRSIKTPRRLLCLSIGLSLTLGVALLLNNFGGPAEIDRSLQL